MARYPGEVNSIQSRSLCKTCFSEPTITAKGTVNDAYIVVTASCHGETETRNMTVAELRTPRTIEFFKKPEE